MAWKHSAKLLVLLCGLWLSAILSPPLASASPNGLAEIQADIGHQLALAGPHDGAYVYDLTDKRALFSQRATTMRPPASVEKLYTAAAVLAQLGASTRLSTSVLGTGQLLPGGIWEGNLYLHGGGDPTFGSSAFIRRHYGGEGASVSALVSQLVHTAGIRGVTGSVLADDSYFDVLRGEPSSGYALDPFLEGTLSALAFDRGSSGSEKGSHAPASYAAHRLAAALREAGVKVRGATRVGRTPTGALPLAAVQSPTIAQMLGLMLPPSDNFFAETLLKDLGASASGAGTTAAGAAAAMAAISRLLDIHPRMVDGSGLSRSNKTSPYQVTDMLVELASTTIGTVLREHLAIAGQSGTLERRMRHTRAAGRCRGKTGTLTGASNLVGYCETANGHLLAFAIFNDAISTTAAHTFQDHIVITLASSKPQASSASVKARG